MNFVVKRAMAVLSWSRRLIEAGRSLPQKSLNRTVFAFARLEYSLEIRLTI